MYPLKRITPNSEIGLPLTVEEAKMHLRVDGTEEDDYIKSLIGVATNKVQNITNRQLMRATFQLSVDRLPSSLPLPRPPFAAITNITAIDDAGQEVVFEDTYYTTTATDYTTLRGVLDSGWYASTYKDIVIEYEAGYESAAEIPEDILYAIKALITFFYENRGEVNKPIPEFIYNLLGDYRIFSF